MVVPAASVPPERKRPASDQSRLRRASMRCAGSLRQDRGKARDRRPSNLPRSRASVPSLSKRIPRIAFPVPDDSCPVKKGWTVTGRLDCIGTRAAHHPTHSSGGRPDMTERRNERTYTDADACTAAATRVAALVAGEGLHRPHYKTGGWKGTLMVVNTVGHLAEAAWHHPDYPRLLRWGRGAAEPIRRRASPTRISRSPGRSRRSSLWQPAKEGGPLRGHLPIRGSPTSNTSVPRRSRAGASPARRPAHAGRIDERQPFLCRPPPIPASGITSMSGTSANARSASRGCGMCSHGSSISTSPKSRMSMSIVRGPQRSIRSRPSCTLYVENGVAAARAA